MDIREIEEIYRYSYNKFDDLHDYFLKYCGFEILITRLSVGYNTFRIRDYKVLDEIKCRDNVKYPPTSNSYSRIGKPKQVWFYLSDCVEASLSEMLPGWYSKIKPGETINIIISKWHIRENIKVMIIPDLEGINNVCKEMDLEAYYKNHKFWAYITKKFKTTTLESKDIYQFTSAFANALLDRAKHEGREIDGIFYPSVQYPIMSNVALLPDAVDNEKVVLSSLRKTTMQKSWIFNSNNLPQYKQISDFEHGYYEPDKDIISWD